MKELEQDFEPSPEFHMSKKKFLINLIKLIPKMRKMRKRVDEFLLNWNDPKCQVETPSLETIKTDLEVICKEPHRRIGTKQGNIIEDFLESKLKELGLESVKKEPIDIVNWVATKWKLIISGDREQIEVHFF